MATGISALAAARATPMASSVGHRDRGHHDHVDRCDYRPLVSADVFLADALCRHTACSRTIYVFPNPLASDTVRAPEYGLLLGQD
jgi:hypothetical protein